jgi:hypothetical protein
MMGLLIIPLLGFLAAAPMPGPPAQVLADFSRFSKAISREISIVDNAGTVHHGVLAAVGSDSVTLKVGSGMQSFARTEIASAEHMKDGRLGGAIKGALFGLFFTAMASQGYDSTTPGYVPWVSVAAYAGAGYLLDAAENNPQPLYRAQGQPKAARARPKPGLSLSIRF